MNYAPFYKHWFPVLIIGMFYYVLGNIQPALRSTQRAIQLVACIESPILVKYGFEKVLAPFIKDVNTLSEVSWIYIKFEFITNFTGNSGGCLFFL